MKKSFLEQRLAKDKSFSKVHPSLLELDEIELFRTFKKYDRNMNGTLTFSEYAKCLKEAPGLGFSEQEIVTLGLCADINGDSRIDYEDFMKHYAASLNMIHFFYSLAKAYDVEYGLSVKAKDADFSKVGNRVANELQEF